MSYPYQIIVQNAAATALSFYAFQQQAAFEDSQSTLTISSSALAAGELAPYSTSGSQLTFTFSAQNYAGAKSDIPYATAVKDAGLRSTRTNVLMSSEASALQPIQLSASGTPANASTLSVSPLGLSPAAYQPDVPIGYFAISVPTFSNSTAPNLCCGCAAVNQNGIFVLSSFLSPLPNSTVNCAPVPIFYVKMGKCTVGEVIAYSTMQSGECNFTSGVQTIKVVYNSDGTFTVTPA
jgi:hypothetical protein